MWHLAGLFLLLVGGGGWWWWTTPPNTRWCMQSRGPPPKPDAPITLAISAGLWANVFSTAFVLELMRLDPGLRIAHAYGASSGSIVAAAATLPRPSLALAAVHRFLASTSLLDVKKGFALCRGGLFAMDMRLGEALFAATGGGVGGPCTTVAFNASTCQDAIHPLLGRPRQEMIEKVLASCAIPVLFAPIRIDGESFADGGLLHRLPLAALRAADRIDGHLCLLTFTRPCADTRAWLAGLRAPWSLVRCFVPGGLNANTPSQNAELTRAGREAARAFLAYHRKGVRIPAPLVDSSSTTVYGLYCSLAGALLRMWA
jgi:hypothetical protein